MPEVMIQQGLWSDLVAIAQRQKKKPETVARRALTEFIQRVSDEELLEKSAATARRAPFRMEQTEDVIRTYRCKKNA